MDIIFTHGGGRFANQFFNQLNLSAFEIENRKAHCISLPFLKYGFFKSDTPSFSLKTISLYLIQKLINQLTNRRSIQSKANNYLIRLLHKIAYNNYRMKSYACHVLYEENIQAEITGETSLVKLVSGSDIQTYVLAGWPIRCWDLVEKHATALRENFILKPEYIKPAQDIIDSIKASGFQKIIGIQVRQDDYREFLNGKYYFSADDYLRFSEKIADLLYPNQKVALLITSDTPQNKLHSSLPIFLGPARPLGNNHYISDLAALSLCDLIIAPPSTFASSASFLGKVPYLPLQSADQVADLNDILQNGLFDAIKDPILSTIIS